MAKKKYRMAGLLDLLYVECGEIVESGEHGYVSVSESVKDAVNRSSVQDTQLWCWLR